MSPTTLPLKRSGSKLKRMSIKAEPPGSRIDEISQEEDVNPTDEQRIKKEKSTVDSDPDDEATYDDGLSHYHSKPGHFSPEKLLEKHDQPIVEENLATNGKKHFTCSECEESFDHFFYLAKHHRHSHLGLKPFCCDKCGKRFTYKPSLVAHQRVHTGEKPYSCSDCGKLFASKFNLKIHEKIHSGNKPMVCPACGKGFSNNPALVKHLRIHTGEKPFMCKECGKSFTNQSNLISHRIIHTGKRPYTCTECGKGFANQSNLAKHKIIHTNEKPFLCIDCGKFFNRKGSLDKHRQRIHEKTKHVLPSPGTVDL